MPIPDLAHNPLSDAALLDEVTRLAAEGRRATSELVALLVAVDTRRLYLAGGYQSLFDFCQRRLRLSESETYHRIEAARTARLFPSILERLRAGALTLTNIGLLRPHLTEANHQQVLAWAEGRTKREVEVFVRTLDPRPDVRAAVRRLPEPRPRPACAMALEATSAMAAETMGAAGTEVMGACAASARGFALEGASAGPHAEPPPSIRNGANIEGLPAAQRAGAPDGEAGAAAVVASSRPLPPRPAEIRPLAPARYSLQVTISEETRARLRRAQALLWHAEPNADEAVVLDRALTLLVETLERKKFAALKLRPPRKSAADSATTLRRSTTGLGERTPHGGQASRRRPDIEGDAADGPCSRGDVHRGCGDPPGAGKLPSSSATDACDVRPVSVTPAGSPGRLERLTRKTPARLRSAPARRSRAIPAAVRREVWLRDAGACAYVGPAGRCGRTAGLEFHHRVPVADGGASTAANVTLRCVRHHALESERWFGPDTMPSIAPSGGS